MLELRDVLFDSRFPFSFADIEVMPDIKPEQAGNDVTNDAAATPNAENCPSTATLESSQPPPSEEAMAASEEATGQQEPQGKDSQEEKEGEAKPSGRLKIGTQRSGASKKKPEAKSAIPSADPHAAGSKSADAKHYPPPNVRDRLSPELEQELEEALGGASLDSLLESAGSATEEIAEGTRLTAKVARIYQDNVFIDLGRHNQGLLSVKQFEGKDLPEAGSSIDVVAVRFSVEDGLYDLTLPGAAVEVGDWDDVEEGQVVEVAITGSNKGGLECQVSGLRGFMPMGQISLYRVENPEEYIGQRLNAVITEANRGKRNLVLSHRAVMEREKAENREKMLAELAPGQLREGIVRSLRDFGAFVDLGGIDGLIHVSKMSWERVNHPSEVLEVGQTVKVKIERLDPDTGKIGLSYRESAENPWDSVETKYTAGMRANGTVSKLMDFGAFVKLEAGIEGLIHISELTHGRIFRTSDAVSEGQAVEVKVLSVDRDKQRISLSLRALMEPPKKAGDKEGKDPNEYTPHPDAPKAPKKKSQTLKGGTGSSDGGSLFGLKL